MKLHRRLEALAILTFAALWIVLAVRSKPPWEAWLLVPAGLLVADLISGIVHWLADSYGSPTTPYLGPAFIRPFREHHSDPLGITRHDFIELNGNSAMVVMPALVAAFWLPPLATPGILAMALAILFTNTIHRWAHMDHPPRAVRALQRMRLILSREHHGVHHAPPHANHYCIFAGWTSRALDGFVRITRRTSAAASPRTP